MLHGSRDSWLPIREHRPPTRSEVRVSHGLEMLAANDPKVGIIEIDRVVNGAARILNDQEAGGPNRVCFESCKVPIADRESKN